MAATHPGALILLQEPWVAALSPALPLGPTSLATMCQLHAASSRLHQLWLSYPPTDSEQPMEPAGLPRHPKPCKHRRGSRKQLLPPMGCWRMRSGGGDSRRLDSAGQPANGWRMAGEWLANGWRMAGEWLANGRRMAPAKPAVDPCWHGTLLLNSGAGPGPQLGRGDSTASRRTGGCLHASHPTCPPAFTQSQPASSKVQ
jgi:hypothetical protein